MTMNENHFVLGDFEYMRDPKTCRCYWLNEKGKKNRISNTDYEEYLLEAQRREIEEMGEQLVSSNENQTESVIEQPKVEDSVVKHYIDEGKIFVRFGARSADNPIDIAKRISEYLREGKGVSLGAVGVHAIANAVLAVKHAEQQLSSLIPCHLEHKKILKEDGKELDAISFVIYPDVLFQQNFIDAMLINKIAELYEDRQILLKKAASSRGNDETATDQLDFPWGKQCGINLI